MHPMLNIALRAARDASNTILEAVSRPNEIKVFEKGPNDFFTNIDKAVEDTLLYHLQKTYPTHSFLCEESGVIEGEDSDTVWIIDPIDGTRNFMHGYPHFCISIACKQGGKIQHGLIVDPVRNEEFSATKGQGAYLNGSRIRVGDCSSLEQATVSLACAGAENYDTFLEIQHRMKGKVSSFRFTGSSALDLAYIACGRLDAGWMAGMKFWDFAAGLLIASEAGALVSDAKGNPDCYDAKSLVFGNNRCFKQLLKMMPA